jgi:hypothetical protein
LTKIARQKGGVLMCLVGNSSCPTQWWAVCSPYTLFSGVVAPELLIVFVLRGCWNSVSSESS